MDLLRLLVVHTLIGTSVALGMALVPMLAWLVQRLSQHDAGLSWRLRREIASAGRPQTHVRRTSS